MKNGNFQAGKKILASIFLNCAKTYLVTGLLNAPGAVLLKEILGVLTLLGSPDYQTGLLWYEKQANRRSKRGYKAINI